MKKLIGGMLFLSLSFSAFSEENKNTAKVIRVAASLAAVENIFEKIKPPFEKTTGIKLEIKEMVASHAILEIMNGKADIAVNSISNDLIEAGIKKVDPSFQKLPSNLVRSIIGRDNVGLIINSDTKVTELDHAQVVKLTAGEASNWNELGGADVPIKFVKIKASSGTFWEKEVLKGKSIRKQDSDVDSIKQIAEVVGNTKGGFGIVPQGTKANAKTSKPTIPVYGRPVQAWTIGAPSEEVKRLYQFLREEGKNYIDK